MNPNVFHEALRATARIACCAGLVSIVACQTKTDDSSTTSDSATPSEPENAIVIPEEPNFAECMEAIDAGYADPAFDTTALLDCCLLTTEEVGYDGLYNDPEYANLQENCCAEIATANEFSGACTPWGPPTPPAMCNKEGGVVHA